MNHLVVNSRTLVVGIALCTLATATLATPTGRAVVVVSLVRVAEAGTKVLRLPYWNVDRSKCFSLDRLNPTCPPYL
jgi:hypothetical protein